MGFWLTFFMWIASFLLSDYFRAKLPAQEPSGEGDFKSPTSTEGRKVPQIIGGTVKVLGPNTLWRGEWEATPVTITTGIVFKKDETVGYKYSIALALGQFLGRSSGMTAVYMGDDKIWDYVDDNSGVPGMVADIDLPDLFGGNTKGGGFIGRVRAFTGENGQAVSAFLDSRVTNQSAWPGFVYVVISDLSETSGADIGETNQLRDIRVEWQTFDTVANGGLGNELGLTGDTHIIGRDANPISCAYRLMSDVDFGISIGEIDIGNFQAAAQICFDEGIGYSQLVDSEIEAYAVLAEIEKHIDGYIGPNPSSGLMEVTLARNDYTPAAEFQATEENILKIIDYAKPEWPQTKNEVKVLFINRDKDYADDYAIVQDMAGRLIAGRPQSVTIRFPGLREAAAANGIVSRTARAYFWPLAKFQLELDRTAYALRPGSVVVVTHTDIGAVDLLTRVTRVRTGDPVGQTIKADVVEDVFAFETGVLAPPQPSGDVPPDVDPVAITDHTNTLVPRWLLETNDQELEPRLLFLVARDSPNNSYVFRYRTRNQFTSGNFTAELDDASPAFCLRGTLRAALIQLTGANVELNDGQASVANGGGFQVDGSLTSLVGTYSPAAALNGLAVINPGEANEEWVAIGAVTNNGAGIECTGVIRGLGDSPILPHAINEPIYFVDNGAYMQANARPQETDNDFGYQYTIAPVAYTVVGTFSGLQAEQHVNDFRLLKPYPPTAIVFLQHGSTTWFPTDDTLDCSAPDVITAPTAQGLAVSLYNRRFDQLNFVFGANSTDESDVAYIANSFNDVDPTIQWWVYDLDTTPNPTQDTDSIGSGEFTSQDDRINTFTIDQTEFQAMGVLSGFNGRVEFNFKNTVALAEVPMDAESAFAYMDKIITFSYGALQRAAVADTVLLLHFNGFDRTTQVIDHSIYDHPVTLNGGAEIDTDVSPDTGMGSGSMIINGTNADYASIPDHSAFNLTCDPGFVIQCRARWSVAPTGAAIEHPLVSKWDESGNEMSWWMGLIGDRMIIKLSVNGTDIAYEASTGNQGWSANTWYDLAICVVPGRVYYWRNGLLWWTTGTGVPTGALFDSVTPVQIGVDSEGETIDSEVHIDEVRILTSPLYRGPFTPAASEFPGRNRINVFHCNWENAVDGDQAYISDCLNREPLVFPSAEVTQIDDAQSKFGNNSLYCGGVSATGGFDNSDGIATTNYGDGDIDEENLDFGTDRDITIECFVRFEILPSAHSAPNGPGLLTKMYRGTTPFLNWELRISKANSVIFTYREEGNINHTLSSTETIAIDTWYHVAFCRKDGVGSLFFEGNRVATHATSFLDLNMENWGDGQLGIGRWHQWSSSDHAVLQGWLDEVRILNGIAEYDGATYTVPTAAFPVQSPEAQPDPPAVQSNWQPTNL